MRPLRERLRRRADPRKIALVKNPFRAYVSGIDFWPDHMAVSPLLIAGALSEPPNIDKQRSPQRGCAGVNATALTAKG